MVLKKSLRMKLLINILKKKKSRLSYDLQYWKQSVPFYKNLGIQRYDHRGLVWWESENIWWRRCAHCRWWGYAKVKTKLYLKIFSDTRGSGKTWSSSDVNIGCKEFKYFWFQINIFSPMTMVLQSNKTRFY